MNDATDNERASVSADKIGGFSRRPIGGPYLKRQPLVGDLKTTLCSEIERTGVGAMRLLRGAKDKPVGLSANVIQSWIHGPAKSAVPAHVDYVLRKWAALPSVTRIKLTGDMQATLRTELGRAGVAVSRLCKHADFPGDLTAGMILSWIKPKASNYPPPGLRA